MRPSNLRRFDGRHGRLGVQPLRGRHVGPGHDGQATIRGHIGQELGGPDLQPAIRLLKTKDPRAIVHHLGLGERQLLGGFVQAEERFILVEKPLRLLLGTQHLAGGQDHEIRSRQSPDGAVLAVPEVGDVLVRTVEDVV